MSKDYRLTICMELAQAKEVFERENEDEFMENVLLYLCLPGLDPKEHEQNVKEIPLLRNPIKFEYHEGHLHKEATTVIHCTYERSFSGGYGEDDYRKDALQQIERLKKELPFKFDLEILVICLEIDPSVVIHCNDITEENNNV